MQAGCSVPQHDMWIHLAVRLTFPPSVAHASSLPPGDHASDMPAVGHLCTAALAARAARSTPLAASSCEGGLPAGSPTLLGLLTSSTCLAPGTATAREDGCQLSRRPGTSSPWPLRAAAGALSPAGMSSRARTSGPRGMGRTESRHSASAMSVPAAGLPSAGSRAVHQNLTLPSQSRDAA